MNENGVLYFTVMPFHGDVIHSLLLWFVYSNLLQVISSSLIILRTLRDAAISRTLYASTYVLAMCHKSCRKFDVPRSCYRTRVLLSPKSYTIPYITVNHWNLAFNRLFHHAPYNCYPRRVILSKPQGYSVL